MGVAAAAQAAREALEGGPAVAVVTILEAPSGTVEPGLRLLLFEDGRRRGTTGDVGADRLLFQEAGFALGTQALGTDAPGRDAGGPSVTWAAASDAVGDAAAPGAVEGGEVPGVVEVRVPEGRYVAFLEVHRAPDEMVVVGAGHVAVPLVELAVRVGFRVTVMDDRDDFVEDARFPAASRVMRLDFADPFRDIRLHRRTWIVLVTRAHRYDYECLRRLLAGTVPVRYIGMIGSRRRVRAAFRALLAAGVARERVAQVSAPIGLDIGAETPEEIAVSIVAELIALRRAPDARDEGSEAGAGTLGQAGQGVRLSRRERVLDRLLRREDEGHE
jgi:xanthine dehydrogenase accessory factor